MPDQNQQQTLEEIIAVAQGTVDFRMRYEKFREKPSDAKATAQVLGYEKIEDVPEDALIATPLLLQRARARDKRLRNGLGGLVGQNYEATLGSMTPEAFAFALETLPYAEFQGDFAGRYAEVLKVHEKYAKLREIVEKIFDGDAGEGEIKETYFRIMNVRRGTLAEEIVSDRYDKGAIDARKQLRSRLSEFRGRFEGEMKRVAEKNPEIIKEYVLAMVNNLPEDRRNEAYTAVGMALGKAYILQIAQQQAAQQQAAQQQAQQGRAP